MCQASNCPQVRFVERAGTTIIEELGKNNPWASEWYCPRQDCLPCQGRMELAAEAEEEAGKMLDKSEVSKLKAGKADRKSLPSCISEGANYCIECLTHVCYNYASNFVVFIVNSGHVYCLVKGYDSAMSFSATMVIFIYYVVRR